ncbi:peroxidase [Oryctes borbonicus]|uniref:Peroxidase n=1 Tax=Oryctes borbonicus TaxID=1629725 RepID=A0A0T6B7C2_9SCAR|nr:peroxidase [Oryctes borbonicus]
MTALPALISMIPQSLMNETAESFAEMVDILIRTPAQVPSIHINVPLRKEWDTATLMMHMSRDHGLPGYVAYAQLCHNITSSAKKFKFEDLYQFGISRNNIDILKELYSAPEDIDLLAGGLLEKPNPGAAIGPTFSCLLEKQFVLLRQSDRFWYENDLPPSSLTSEQLTEIRKVTLAGLLCANTDDLDKIQPKAFVQEDIYLNARISCNQHPTPQFAPWLEMDHMTDLSEDMLMDALIKAEQEVLQRRKMEYEVWNKYGGVDPKSPTGTAASFSKANKQALKLANSSLLFEFASNEIINSLINRRRKRQTFGNILQPNDFTDSLQSVDLSTFLQPHAFDFDPTCDDNGICDETTPFRTFSGYCNNLRNPTWGKSLTTFTRLLPSQYEDGISRPRVTGVTGVPLPSPRIVSTVIHPDISNLHSRYTLMTMQWAQFLDHDLTMTPIHKGFHESIPNCRSCDSSRTVHPECNPFPVPKHDHYYPEINVTTGEKVCFPFMRSLPGQQSLGPRQQVNQNTAFLDASQVYGENNCVSRDLKGMGGRMNCTIHPIRGKDLLPQSDHHPECRSGSGLCFIAGDGRASEQPALTTIHTVFMREHNRLVEGLKRVNPHWDEETMFENARKILIAETQHITYNEFLPRILSWNAVNLYGLKLLPQGYYTDYNPSCNPSILNEFAAAAFRIGHSLLRPHIPRLSEDYQIVNPPILLRDGFFKVDMIMAPLMVDEITRGLISTPMESLDQFITGEVTNHLFEDRRIPFSGVDLIALNIQRARDHGVPSYNNYRALCNLKRATSFDDLAREIPPEIIARFKKIYATVDDIDLFPGGMSERPLKGGLVGPTFACIIAIQFRQLRKCDRFWYENSDPIVRFTEAQLAEIRKTTLAKTLCNNLDIHSDVQRAAFDLPSNFLNPRIPCSSLPDIDFNVWREQSGHGCVLRDRHLQVGDSAFPSPCTSCICSEDGVQCASLKITDCSQLMKEWPRDVILRDDVCTAQCGFFLRESSFSNFNIKTSSTLTQTSINTGLIPPPARTVRSRPVIPHFNTNINPFNGFKFPDLTPFVI